MDSGIHLIILTPTQKLADVQDVNEVYFKTSSGTLGIMPGYAPTITDIDIGIVVYTKGNTSGIIKASGGLVDIEEGNKVTLFADVAEDAAHIDLARAQKSLERAEQLLADANLSESERKHALNAKLRALARIAAVELYQKVRSE